MGLMSIRQPVNFAASLAFCPSLPIARESWFSGTWAVAVRESRTATAHVPENQLSLAIGKDGQNARLAAKLTGWRIDIKPTAEGPHPDPPPQAGEGMTVS